MKFTKNVELLEILGRKPSKKSLDQEKHFKHEFGVGQKFEKIWINIKNIGASADIY